VTNGVRNRVRNASFRFRMFLARLG